MGYQPPQHLLLLGEGNKGWLFIVSHLFNGIVLFKKCFCGVHHRILKLSDLLFPINHQGVMFQQWVWNFFNHFKCSRKPEIPKLWLSLFCWLKYSITNLLPTTSKKFSLINSTISTWTTSGTGWFVPRSDKSNPAWNRFVPACNWVGGCVCGGWNFAESINSSQL